MTITPKLSAEQTLAEIDSQARIDPTRAETSFVKGRNLFLKREDAPYRSLLSLESSTYQGMMYRVRRAPPLRVFSAPSSPSSPLPILHLSGHAVPCARLPSFVRFPLCRGRSSATLWVAGVRSLHTPLFPSACCLFVGPCRARGAGARSHSAARLQGAIQRGIMRWRLTVVRPCDMFWMGVTSRFSLDMSTMIANDRQVWMISEEATCFEHCRCACPLHHAP